tara:strand:- start:585 stop:851 length:267 start_codon:yes stop_codon:yes gene_type:complete
MSNRTYEPATATISEVEERIIGVRPIVSVEMYECLVAALKASDNGSGVVDEEKYRETFDACLAAKMPGRVVFMAGVVVGIVIGVIIAK